MAAGLLGLLEILSFEEQDTLCSPALVGRPPAPGIKQMPLATPKHHHRVLVFDCPTG